MTDSVIETTICHECCAEIGATDNYCRHCGMTTANLAGQWGGNTSAASRSVNPALSLFVRPKWSESPWIVLPLLFLLLGPFALPLLWRSHRFTPVWKSVLTVAVAGVTLFAIWSVWFSLQQALAPLGELDKLRAS
jgi:ribosomal protein L40E